MPVVFYRAAGRGRLAGPLLDLAESDGFLSNVKVFFAFLRLHTKNAKKTIDFAEKKSKIASRTPTPKLVVWLEPRKLYELESESLPQLEIAHSIITQITPVDDVMAAILAMENQPVPIKSLSLQGS